jgi:transcriptional regulator with XRE-family HTH domain
MGQGQRVDKSAREGNERVHGRIKLARRRLSMTQEELAREVGVSLRTVQSWEAGKAEPRPAHRRKLALLVGEPASWFLEEEEVPAA